MVENENVNVPGGEATPEQKAEAASKDLGQTLADGVGAIATAVVDAVEAVSDAVEAAIDTAVEAVTAPRKPKVGDFVDYVLPDDSPRAGQIRPAIVVFVWGDGGCLNLQVFVDGTNDGVGYPANGTKWVTSAMRGKGSNTWRFPGEV